AAHAATPRCLGTPAAAPNRGAAPRGRVPHSTGGLGSRTATLCCASPTVPLAEPIPETGPSAIRSPASEVVGATAYRYRVTFALLRLRACSPQDQCKLP